MAQPAYDRDWKRVDSLAKQRLTRQAAEAAAAIRLRAERDQNDPQYLKALFYELGSLDAYEAQSDSLQVSRLRGEIRKAPALRRAVLQSALAVKLADYYSENQWMILDRGTLESASEDFQTWDAAAFYREISTLFFAALSDPGPLRQAPVGEYRPILLKQKGSEQYRSTLYDLLAHQAIDFFNNTAADHPQPEQPFRFSIAQGLLPAAQFVQAAFDAAGEPDAPRYRVLRIYQDLLGWLLDRQNPDALVDADLKRLEFVHSYAYDASPEAYRDALEQLAAAHAGHPAGADAQQALAQRWYDEQEYAKAHQICKAAYNAFPRSRGGLNCRALMASIEEKELNLTLEEANLPGQPFRFLLAYRNIKTVYLRIVRVDDEALARISRFQYNETVKKAAFIASLPAVKTWSQALPAETDFKAHRAELRADALAPGRYFLLASDDKAFSANRHALAYANLYSTRWTAVRFSGQQDERFLLADRLTGAPIPGVTVRAVSRYWDNGRWIEAKDSTQTTDALGFVSFSQQPGMSGSRTVIFSRGNETLELDGEYFRRYEPDYPSAPKPVLYLLTDRRIYRPGQQIFVKGILFSGRDNAYRTLADSSIRLTFRDANNQVIAEGEYRTNRYGSFSATFTAPSSGLLGNYSIRHSAYGSTDFSVEEYKRPTFEVEFDDLQASYQLGEQVTVTGRATAFTGAALDGAEVRFRVMREARWPMWWDYWRFPAPRSSPSQEILQGELRTQPDGSFAVTFPLSPAPDIPASEKPIFTFRVMADVTDISGETRSGNTSLQAGYVSGELEVSLPDQLDRNTPGVLTVKALNLSGNPVPVRGELRISRLDAPERPLRTRRWDLPDRFLLPEDAYRKAFPYDVYRQEDEPSTWKAAAPLLTQTFEGASQAEITLDALRTAEPGRYRVEIRANGDLQDLRTFILSDPQSLKPAQPVWLEYRLSAASAEPGQTVDLTLNSSEADQQVLVQLYHAGRLLQEQWIGISGNPVVLSIPIEAKHRGGLQARMLSFRQNEQVQHTAQIAVPWTDKELKLEWMSFRSPLLPGQQERWTLKITGSQSEAVAAELAAAMYDASLDEFRSNSFYLWPYGSYTYLPGVRGHRFGTLGSQELSREWNTYYGGVQTLYDELLSLNYGAGLAYVQRGGPGRSGGVLYSAAPPPAMMEMAAAAPMEDATVNYRSKIASESEAASDSFQTALKTDAPPAKQEPPAPRRDLRETAFFFPQLETNAAGEIVLNFTMPEALTRWKFLALAHTPDMRVGTLTSEAVTRKDLMVVPNLPRFFRDGDRVVLTAKIVNVSGQPLSGMATLQLADALSERDLSAALGNTRPGQAFSVEAGRSTVVSWTLNIPEGTQPVVVRMLAQAGAFTDGEEHVLPVLSNRILVTETLPLFLRGRDRKAEFTFSNLSKADASPTLRQHRLSVEISSNPAWYAVQALPYLMEFPHACTEQIFSRFYANALASHIAGSNPQIQSVFSQWSQTPDTAALLSALDKNQDLKQALLAETPWVLDAQQEAQRKRHVAILFDLNRMAAEASASQNQLVQRQMPSGGFSWFPGMNESRYITQLIATGFGHLGKLGAAPSGNPEVSGMISKALHYLDRQLAGDLVRLKETPNVVLTDNHLDYTQLQYLYMRSFHRDLPLASGTEEAFNYYFGQAKRYWNKQGFYGMGMLGLVFQRYGEPALAQQIRAALLDNAVIHPEQGMSWKTPGGFYWHEAPIETQALLIEAVHEIGGADDAVADMKTWLLNQKRTTDWRTTRATVAACNALLLTGEDWLSEPGMVETTVGKEKISPAERPDLKTEAGTGYYQVSWQGSEIKPGMAKISLKKNGKQPAWGAAYWQYFEQMDRVTGANTQLSLKKELFLERNTPQGPVLSPLAAGAKLKPGDKVVVRMELRSDRDLEYVHLKDHRGAGFEPMSTLSRYQFQHGLGYYESPRDAATDFFIEYLPKGTWVFEYAIRANLEGEFSCGLANIQCMYAPEFSSHSEGIRVEIGKP
ncbi:MAG: alpha-2-macroglobulin family protein [Bacteroidia bacterium]|nr:alpha-2-macroglobulin family protein [Bacteroidia bacterium]